MSNEAFVDLPWVGVRSIQSGMGERPYQLLGLFRVLRHFGITVRQAIVGRDFLVLGFELRFFLDERLLCV